MYCAEASAHRLEAAVLACWLLKDAGWALLLAPVAFAAAVVALGTEIFAIFALWSRHTAVDRARMLAELAWLLGNAVWMLAEILYYPFEEVSLGFPWFKGPLLEGSQDAYSRGVFISQCILGSGLAALVCFYLGAAVHYWRGPKVEGQSDEVLIFGVLTRQMYTSLYIGPWILKDFCWSLEVAWPTIAAAAVVLTLVLDYFRRFGGSVHIAELFWVGANTFWAILELGFEDVSIVPRAIVGAVCVLGACRALQGLWDADVPNAPAKAALAAATEETPLRKVE